MAKRITYSIPLRQVWKEYKKWCKVSKSTDGEQFFEELRLLAYKDQNITTRTATLRMASFGLMTIEKKFSMYGLMIRNCSDSCVMKFRLKTLTA